MFQSPNCPPRVVVDILPAATTDGRVLAGWLNLRFHDCFQPRLIDGWGFSYSLMPPPHLTKITSVST